MIRYLMLTTLANSLAISSWCFANDPTQATRNVTAAHLLPNTVVAYAEVANPNPVIDVLLNHPLRERLEALSSIEMALKSPAATRLWSAVALFDAGMGQRWPKTLASLSHGGIYVAFDIETKGAVLLAKSNDRSTLERFRDTVLAAVKANQPGRTIRVNDYRGMQAYGIQGDGRIALMDDWLLVTNKAQLGKLIADQFVDGKQECLATLPTFQQAQETRDAQTGAWGFVNLDTLRSAGVARELYQGRSPNALVEMLLGGILGDLQTASFGTVALTVGEKKASFSVVMPHDSDAAHGSREYYFGADGSAVAPALLDVPNQIFAASLHRDLSQMWLRADELLSEKGSDQLAKADSQLTTFFSGRDFGEDILGALESDIQLVVVRQSFADRLPQPAIKLPAVALQFRMKSPEATGPDLRRTFQSFVGFFNVIGAMQGQPQLDLGMQTEQGFQLITASYIPEPDVREAQDAAINFNFSPTLALAGERVVLASTRELAMELIGTTATLPGSALPVNSIANLEAQPLVEVLSDNQEQLIAENMIKEGHSHEEAASEIKALFELMGLFQNADMKLKVEGSVLQFDVELNLLAP